MAYPQSVKTRAYNYFVAKGYTCEAIARLLRKEYPKITANTVRAWSETRSANPNKLTWVEEKESVEKDVVERVKERTVSVIAGIRSKNVILLEEVYKRILTEAPAAKSFEGLIYSWKALASFEANLEKEAGEKDKLSPAQVIQIILEIFQANPKIATVIRAEWASVSEKLHQQLLEDHST